MNLSEAIEHFRSLSEGVKVGDYVVARDGRDGYADRVEGGQVYFVYTTNKFSENVVLDIADVNVTTVEDVALHEKRNVKGMMRQAQAGGLDVAGAKAKAQYRHNKARERGTKHFTDKMGTKGYHAAREKATSSHRERQQSRQRGDPERGDPESGEGAARLKAKLGVRNQVKDQARRRMKKRMRAGAKLLRRAGGVEGLKKRVAKRAMKNARTSATAKPGYRMVFGRWVKAR